MIVRTLLALSLLVNIALISFIATQTVSNARYTDIGHTEGRSEGTDNRGIRGEGRRLPRELRILANLDSLTPEQRSMVRQVIEAQLPAVREKGKIAREASRAFRDSLDDPDFDITTARTLASAVTATRRDHQETATSLLLDAMAVLPPEARRTLSDERRARREKRRKRRDRRYKHD